MSKSQSASGDAAPDEIMTQIRAHEDGMESLANRDDLIGAWARILLALSEDTEPDDADLIEAGLTGIVVDDATGGAR